MSFVPENIECLVDAAGTDAVLAFLEACGGKSLYVPQKPENSHIAQMFGDDLAVAVCQNFGPGTWIVPMHKAWRIVCYRNAGIAVSEMATRTGLSVRQIYATLKHVREKGLHVAQPRSARYVDERQIPLF